MSERYTSPDLSRRLRDAGLDQRHNTLLPRWLFPDPPGERDADWDGEDDPVLDEVTGGVDRWYRALRLDEVLEELHAAGLAVHWASSSKEAFVSAIPSAKFKGRSNMAEHAEAVEAAGLVLLALLEARKGGEA